MLLDSQLADICAGTYDSTYQFDKIWPLTATRNVWVSLKKMGGFDVVAFRGSETPGDWFKDIVTDLYLHPVLGGVHQGFSFGIDETYDAILKDLKQPLIIVGHSLGAARALLVAGLMVARGIPVSKVMTCGSPRPGVMTLKTILKDIEIKSYHNRFDPVPYLPVPSIGLNYTHPRELIKINIAPPLLDIEPLADHHIELYQAGIKALEAH